MKRLTLLCLILFACASTVQAASKPAAAPAPSCDRECLRGMLTEYLYALLKHDSSKLPLSDKVRVTGKQRDDLQSAIALLRKASVGVPLQFENFRD